MLLPASLSLPLPQIRAGELPPLPLSLWHVRRPPQRGLPIVSAPLGPWPPLQFDTAGHPLHASVSLCPLPPPARRNNGPHPLSSSLLHHIVSLCEGFPSSPDQFPVPYERFPHASVLRPRSV